MDARRTLIADSALAVIAASGMRGLTHLAVDQEAGLAKGSTSYYCRKRIDLLRLALERLFAIDRAEMEEAVHLLTTNVPHTEEYITDTVAGVVEHWLTEPRRAVTYARFELFLAVAHEPELQDMNKEHMLQTLQLFLAVGNASEPPKAIEQLATTAMVADGLMLVVLRQGLPTPSRSEIAELLATAIGGAPHPTTSDGRPTSPKEELVASLWGTPDEPAITA